MLRNILMSWLLLLCELPSQSSGDNYGDTLGHVAEINRGFSAESMKVLTDCVRHRGEGPLAAIGGCRAGRL